MRTRKTAMVVSLVVVLALIVAATVLLTVAHFKKHNGIDYTEIAQTASEIESFDDVPDDFSLKLASKDNVTEKDYIVYDQNGNAVAAEVDREKDGGFRIVAPSDGWASRGVYKVKLTNQHVEFADAAIRDRRDVSFTVHGEEVCEINTVSAVKEITPSDTEVFDVKECSGGDYIIDMASRSDVSEGDIIILPELNEMGFEVKSAYKVESIKDGKVYLSKPALEEVFDDLDILQSYEAQLDDDCVMLASDGEIEEQIAGSEVVQRLASKSESGGRPKIEFTVKLKGAYAEFVFKVTFPEFLDDFDFVMQGTAKISFGVKANISIFKRTYDLGAVISLKTEVKFALSKEDKTDKDKQEIESRAAKRLQEVLNKNKKSKELAVKLFNLYIPTPVPLLGFSFEVKAKFKLEAKVEIGLTVSDEITNSFGIKKTCDGVEPYNNKTVVKKTGKVEVCGSIEAKLGFSVKFSGSLCGVIKAGVESEIGAYAKLAGFFKVQAVEKLSDPGNNDEDFIGSGGYFEAGIYADLSAFAELKVLWHTFKAKATIIEVRIPVLSIGRTQMITLKPEKDSVVLDERGRAPFPDINVKTTDMFTGKTEEKKISGKELTDKCSIIAGDSIKFDAKENEVYIENNALQELESKATVKMRAFQSFLPKFEITAGLDGVAISIKGKRGLIHLELGAMGVSCNVTVTKKPVPVQKLQLVYERVEADSEYGSLHPELEESEAEYRPREDIGGVVDYQVGRLVRVKPHFSPSNASYKQLKYEIESGAQYIVGGSDGIETYSDGGATYAIFRVVDDPIAIGNVNGTVDLAKMIKVTATTVGYTGKYSDMNVSDSTAGGIFASSVPVVTYGISPIFEGQSVKRTAVLAGERVPFGIENDSVFPKNATRGEAYESLTIVSDYAHLDRDNNIVIDSDAAIGGRIMLISEFSGVEREFFLNIVKNDVESISLSAEAPAAKPGSDVEIEAHITGNGDATPTVTEVVFVVCDGSGKAVVTSNFNRAKLSIASDAVVGSTVRVFAIADGKRSNIIEIEVVKIAVERVSLTTSHAATVSGGESIRLDAEIMPKTASHKKTTYEIADGNAYAKIDSYDGVLTINNECVGGETITVTATADGVVSNSVVFTVRSVNVTYVKFPLSVSTVRDGQAVALDAFVNPDATDKSITYTITQGDSIARIEDDELIINSGLSHGQVIKVRAESVGDSSVFGEKQFIIYCDKSGISINGEYDTVYLVNGETATVTVTDENGDIVNNADVEFSLTQAGQGTALVTVDSAGTVSVSKDIPEEEDYLEFSLDAVHNGVMHSIFINVLVKPALVALTTVDDKDRAALRPNETVYLDIACEKQGNATLYDDVEAVTSGALSASVESIDEGFGVMRYRLRVQVQAMAKTGDEATVYVICKASGKVLCKSEQFTVSVARITESVEILNAPTTLGIGKSVTLCAEGYPQDTSCKPTFVFADGKSRNYATLDAKTGLLTVENNAYIVGNEITVLAKIDNVSSKPYVIKIDDEIRRVSISPSSQSKGVQYVEELESYFLYPDGKIDLKITVDGGGVNPDITIQADKIGQKYLEISGRTVTVKSIDINHGINATIVAYADNGIVSEPMVIYIPTAITSAQDLIGIADNVNGYYVLTRDIDFGGVDISPIPIFGGILDGNGHTIKNINFDGLDERGCFGLISENRGMIFNLEIYGVSVVIDSATDIVTPVYGGALCAKNYGKIVNCTIASTSFKFVYVSLLSQESFVAGLCGYNDGDIRACRVSLYISSASYAAGMAGINDINGTVTDCVNFNDIYYGGIDMESCVDGIIAVDSGRSRNNMNYGQYTISGLAKNSAEVN